MKFKSKGWKHPRPMANREEFLGVLRAELTPDAKDLLKPLLPVKTITRDGMRIEYFADGHVEIDSIYNLMMKMAREIKERDEKRLFEEVEI